MSTKFYGDETEKTVGVMTGCFLHPNRDVTLFKHLQKIKSLPDWFLKILVTHSPLHKNVTKYVDMVLYDRNNVHNPDKQFSYGAAESMLMRQGLILCKYYNIEWMFKFAMDVLPDNIFKILDWIKHTDEGYKMVTFRHGNPGVGTLCFLVNVDWGLKYIPEFRTVEAMQQGTPGKHLEVAIGEQIKKSGQLDKVYYYDTPNKMFDQRIGNVEYYDDCQGHKQDETLLAKFLKE